MGYPILVGPGTRAVVADARFRLDTSAAAKVEFSRTLAGYLRSKFGWTGVSHGFGCLLGSIGYDH